MQDQSAAAIERHYTPNELAAKWGLSVTTIRRLFEMEPGVLRIGETDSASKRRYVTMRIPEHVAMRVHRRLCS
jgi:AraC-like DNA-binding protein